MNARTHAIVAAAVAAVLLNALCCSPAAAAEPPHGHRAFKQGDPRLVANHTLAEPIEHVYDVKAEFMRHYMRPVKGVPNRLTLLVMYTTWCHDVCDKWVPVLKQIALLTREAQIAHRLTIIKHDVTRDSVIAHKLKVEAFPAIGLVEAAAHQEWQFVPYTGAADVDAVLTFLELNSPEHAKEAHEKLRATHNSRKQA